MPDEIKPDEYREYTGVRVSANLYGLIESAEANRFDC
jgi:hypothetical protein